MIHSKVACKILIITDRQLIKSESKLQSLAATYLSNGWCREQKTCPQRPLQRPAAASYGAHEGFHQKNNDLKSILPYLY